MNKSFFSKISLYAFYVISALNLINQLVKIEWLDMATKPLLMVPLLIYYLTSRTGKTDTLTMLICGALIFSWMGDVLLMLQAENEMLFTAGLIAFLTAHILYMMGYIKAKGRSDGKSYAFFVRSRIMFLMFTGVALLYILYPVLGDLRIPVTVYTAVIISMGIAALLRRGYTNEKSFVSVYGGAVLFILSDSVLAINKFLSPVVYADLIIMASYIIAQFMIVRGILLHETLKEEI
jgi:uncharacterized membrane protein YhhN